MAAAVDVRPHVGPPCHGKIAGMWALTGGALAIRRHTIGNVAADGEQLDGRYAAPGFHVPCRLPATEIGTLRAVGMGFRSLHDCRAQFGIERRRVRYVEENDRRGEQGDDLGPGVHVPSYTLTSSSMPMRTF